MSLRNPLVVFVAFASLALLAACGSSGDNGTVTPPPSGGFTNSNFSGTYVISTNGVDDGGGALSVLGVITADGNGGITAGTIDIVGVDFGVSPPEAVTSGSTYNITADGRGTAVINNAFANISLAFVLTSTGSGLVTNFGGNGLGTGSGTLDLQSAGETQPTDSYAFSFGGIDSSLTSPLATAGAFTLVADGTISTGIEDFNDSGTPLTSRALTGSVVVGTGTNPGVATLSSAMGALGFDFFVVNSSHLKFIETDGVQILAGDAFTQQGSIPSGTLVFTMAGIDSGFFPVAAGGVMTSDGTSISNGAEDLNDGGNGGPSLPFSGSFTPLSNGRAVLNLNTFSPAIQFAVYPSSGGMLMLETDSLALLTGAAFVQTGTSLAASQGYGLNLQAVNLNDGLSFFEEDDNAEFSATSSTFTGRVDFNDQGTTAFNQPLAGTYTLAGSSGTAAFTSGSFVAFDLIFYPVDSSKFIFIEADTNQIGTGSFGMQSSTSAQAALLRAAFAHPKLPGHFNGLRKLHK